jgi:hypothetical protein
VSRLKEPQSGRVIRGLVRSVPLCLMTSACFVEVVQPMATLGAGSTDAGSVPDSGGVYAEANDAGRGDGSEADAAVPDQGLRDAEPPDGGTREFVVTQIVQGAGAARVTSSPAGLDCTDACQARFSEGTQLVLTASAAPGHYTAAWTGCEPTPAGDVCALTVVEDQIVTLTTRQSCVMGRTIGWRTGPVLTPVARPLSLAAIDVDLDGFVDLVTADYDGTHAAVLWGGSGATFSAPTLLDVGPGPVGIHAVDVTGDGRLDLAVSASRASHIAVFDATADRTFSQRREVPVCFNAGPAAVLDLTGEGLYDVVAPCGGGGFEVALGLGAGAFDAATHHPQNVGKVGAFPRGMHGADRLIMKGILTTNGSYPDAFFVLAADSAGVLTTVAHGGGRSGPSDVAVSDLDSDGRPDYVATNWDHSNLTVALGTATGFRERPEVGAQGTRPTGPVVADFNQDCIPDLAWASLDADLVVWASGHGDGTFETPTTLPMAHQPTSLAIADFDQDGRLDIAVARQSQFDSSRAGITVLLNDAR